MTDSLEFSTNGTSGDSDFNPNVDPEAEPEESDDDSEQEVQS